MSVRKISSFGVQIKGNTYEEKDEPGAYQTDRQAWSFYTADCQYIQCHNSAQAVTMIQEG